VDNLSGLESPVLNLLKGNLLTDDNLVSVDAVLLDDVREDTLGHVALVLGHDFVHDGGNILVGGSVLDGTFSSSKSVVSGMKNVKFTTVLGATNDDGVGSVGSKSINVGTADDLGNITFLKLLRLISEGREVTNDVINGDTSGERDTTFQLLGLLAVEDVFALGFDESVGLLANSVDVSSRNAKGHSLHHGS
jgi:hypothetical protein